MATAASLTQTRLPDNAQPQRKHSFQPKQEGLHATIYRSGCSGRAELEVYIRDIFAHSYDARIKHFLPQLMSLRMANNELVAALGIRSASSERLFLENYLDTPVEQRLAEVAGIAVQRDSIVEIGNLASTRAGSARWLFLALAAYLHGRSTEWAIYTVAPFLKNTFLKLGFNMHTLAKADKSRLGDDAGDWGSYYDASPEVMAVEVSQAFYAVLNFAETTGDESLLRLCANAYDMGVRSRG